MARRAKAETSADCCWQVLYGPNEHARRRALVVLLDELLPEADREFALDRLDGAETTATGLLSLAQTLPFMAPRRLVVVTAAQQMPKAEQNALAPLVPRLQPPAVVVLEITAADPKRRAPLEQPLWKALAGHANLQEFKLPKPEEAAGWLAKRAVELGAAIDATAAAALVQRLGPDPAALEQELAKLLLYLDGRGRIDGALVARLSPRQPEEDIFKLTDAIGERRPAVALGLLSDLLRFHNYRPERLLPMIARQFRQIWQVKMLQEARWQPGRPLPPDLADRLPDPAAAARLPGWLYGRLGRQAARFAWPQLEAALDRLLRCDLAVKDIEGAVSRPDLALELLVRDLCGAGAPSRSLGGRWNG